MKKYIYSFLFVGLFTVLSFFSVNNISADDITFYPDVIKDQTLAEKIVAGSDTELDSYDQTLTQQELDDVLSNTSYIRIYNYQSLSSIDSFEGLEKFKNLNMLIIDGYDLQTIPEEVGELTSLTQLVLSDDNISSISNLENLTNLKQLSLDENYISEMTGIETLEDLAMLNLEDNKIQKIDCLDNLNQIEILQLGDNNIPKIEGLDNLTSLIDLDLSLNYINKLEGLNNQVYLDNLDLNSNYITEVENLDNLSYLATLSMNHNLLSDLSGIDVLDSLEFLDVSFNNIIKIDNLDSLNNLQMVQASGQSVKYYLPVQDSYSEIYNETNCTYSGCVFNPSNYTIDNGSYTDTISYSYLESNNYTYNLSFNNTSIDMFPDVDYMYYDVDINIVPTYPVDASDSYDYLTNAASSEADLFTQLGISVSDVSSNVLTDEVYISDLDNYDFDSPSVGTYNITFSIGEENNGLSTTVEYSVYHAPTIASTNAVVKFNQAPDSYLMLLTYFNTVISDISGNEMTGEDILDTDFKVLDFDGYDMDNPKAGTYDMMISYTDKFSTVVTTESTLIVQDEESTDTENNSSPEITETDNADVKIANTGFSYGVWLIIILVIVVIVILIYKKKK